MPGRSPGKRFVLIGAPPELSVSQLVPFGHLTCHPSSLQVALDAETTHGVLAKGARLLSSFLGPVEGRKGLLQAPCSSGRLETQLFYKHAEIENFATSLFEKPTAGHPWHCGVILKFLAGRSSNKISQPSGAVSPTFWTLSYPGLDAYRDHVPRNFLPYRATMMKFDCDRCTCSERWNHRCCNENGLCPCTWRYYVAQGTGVWHIAAHRP